MSAEDRTPRTLVRARIIHMGERFLLVELLPGAKAIVHVSELDYSRVSDPGELFHVPPVPHDSWVVGDEPYVSLHILGADHYARHD